MPVPKNAKQKRETEEATEEARSASVAGSMLEPDEQPGEQARALPIADHNPLRQYKHHPRSWEVVDMDGEPVLLPLLAPMFLEPGVNLVKTRRKDSTDDPTYDTLKRAEQSGCTVLDPNEPVPASCLPKGVPAGGYRRRIRCRDTRTLREGYHYTSCWDVPVRTPPGEPLRFVFDRDSYNRWRLHLVKSGTIEPVLPVVVEDMKREAGRRLRRKLNRMYPSGELTERIHADAKKQHDQVAAAAAAAAAGEAA